LAAFSIVGGLLGLIFSINKTEVLTFNTLFEKPSIAFLISFGIFVELLAASTRVLVKNMIFISTLLFGLVYLGASFLITYYNKQGNNKRYLFLFSLFGIIVETVVGIYADLDRGTTYYTIYFVAAILIGIVSGRLLGIKKGGFFYAGPQFKKNP
jgi:glucose uptake protein GlcU